MHRTLASLVALLAGAGTIACGDSPTDGTPPPAGNHPSISAAALTEGGEGVLTGIALDKLDGVLTVDGTVVAVTTRSASEIRFTMPPTNPCDVDGRDVAVQAGTLIFTGKLSAQHVLRLQVGESMVLPLQTLASACVQVPAGAERYVFTALNPLLQPSSVPDHLLTVRTWVGAPDGMPNLKTASLPRRTAIELSNPQRTHFTAANLSYSDAPAAFDPRYATAVPGDTLPWMDWWGSRYPDCANARELIPTINIVVAAVSTSGKVVIAFDTRSPQAALWRSAPVEARLARMAEIMDRWAVPAVREVMDASYQPLRGAGGRWFHVFRTDTHGWSIDNNDAPQSACRYSSEVPSTVSPDVPPASDAQVEYLAGLAIHEYGHHAESVYRIRRWGTLTPPMRTGAGWQGIGEAWAQLVQESAARLASNQPTGAQYAALDATASGVPYADFYLNAYGETPAQSPWGLTTTARAGYYDQGARFLLFLRERWGDATIGTLHERFFARAQALPETDVTSLAALVGLSAADALDQWSLADATDNLVDTAAAAAKGLPQLQSWVPQDGQPLPSLMIARSAAQTRALSAGRGNYAALYLYGEGADAGRGISLTFESMGAVPIVARITRLR